MEAFTARRWAEQDRHEGDRWRLFRAVADVVDAPTVLYPGSYVDLAPSFVFESVTYVDVDRLAARFFADEAGVREIVAAHEGSPADPEITFLAGDYTEDLGLPAEGFDLLVSLYAGFVSEHCGGQLRVGGTLLVNPSHGDVAMASIDPRFDLTGVVVADSGDYRVRRDDLRSYLRPKRAVEIIRRLLHETNRGIAYTRSPFAYLFERSR